MRYSNTPKEPPAANTAVDPELEAKIDQMMDLAYSEDANNANPQEQSPAESEPATTASDEPVPTMSLFAVSTNEPLTAPEVPADLAEAVADNPEPTAQETTSERLVTIPDSSPTETVSSVPDPVKDDLGDDPLTAQAIADISRKDADTVLEAEDKAKQETALPSSAKHKRPQGKLRSFLSRGWVKTLIFITVLITLLGAGAWPTSRYFVLNTVGVRSSASLTVTDATTGMPLKNVSVRLGEADVMTDREGIAQFKDIKLGKQALVIERVAFAPLRKDIVIGWGSNPLGDQEITATGVQYEITATNLLSGKPVIGAEASSGRASAVADSDGVITLTIDDPSLDTVEVRIAADSYRTETLTFDVTDKTPKSVSMVSARPVVYVEGIGGTYHLSKADADGKNQTRLLSDIGNEMVDGKASISLVVNHDGTSAGLVSKLDPNRTNGKGGVLDAVSIVAVEDGSVQTIDYAEQAQLVTWDGRRLVYTATYPVEKGKENERQRLIVYDTETDARKLLDSAEYIRGIVPVRGVLYYSLMQPNDTTELVSSKSDGSERIVLSDEAAWSLVRTGGNTLGMRSVEGSVEYNISSKQLAAQPESKPGRYYLDDIEKQRSLWIDERQGQTTLNLYTYKTGQDTVIGTYDGLVPPLRWLDARTLAVTLESSDGYAVYALSLDGGEPLKVADNTLMLTSFSAAY